MHEVKQTHKNSLTKRPIPAQIPSIKDQRVSSQLQMAYPLGQLTKSPLEENHFCLTRSKRLAFKLLQLWPRLNCLVKLNILRLLYLKVIFSQPATTQIHLLDALALATLVCVE